MKHPYTITAHIPTLQPAPTQFLTETNLQNAAHAAGIGEHLQITQYHIPAIQIQFTAPPDPIAPEYPEKTAQDAILRLLNAEIRTRYPGAKPKFKLYRTP